MAVAFGALEDTCSCGAGREDFSQVWFSWCRANSQMAVFIILVNYLFTIIISMSVHRLAFTLKQWWLFLSFLQFYFDHTTTVIVTSIPSTLCQMSLPSSYQFLFSQSERQRVSIISWLTVLCPAKSLPACIVEKWLMLHFSCRALKIQKIRSLSLFWDSRKKKQASIMDERKVC